MIFLPALTLAAALVAPLGSPVASSRQDGAASGPASPNAEGFLIHRVHSPFQAGITQVRVLLPKKIEPGARYPAIYILPVEAGNENRYGDGLKEARELGLADRLRAIFVAPTFSQLPWYADHPTNREIRQERHFLEVVIPLVEKHYPVRQEASARFLLGFSKSGWGAYSLLLRHPDRFARAAAWDAPMAMDRPGPFGSGAIFGTDENFRKYEIARLLEAKPEPFRDRTRLVLLGYGNFQKHHQALRQAMQKLRVRHIWRDGPARKHSWHSGWVEEAAVLLLNDPLPWILVAKGGQGFAVSGSDRPFVPLGFNYDRDDRGRLIEDYWNAEWRAVEEHFAQMKALGANVVRVHLQLGRFMESAKKANAKSLDRLSRLLVLAERNRLYLDLTGLGCYHKADVPKWYDALGEAERWVVQSRFWSAIANRCKESPAVFCYDLMNEPVVPGGKRKDGDWLGPAFAGKHFVQFITLDQKGRPRPQIARQWIKQLAAAIRKVDPRHLITVGLVDWSLDRKGLTSGFVPKEVAGDLDFLCVHIYPKSGKLEEALDTLKGFAVGKPVVVEETFPLKCSGKELEQFIERAGSHASGWISFYWGKPPEKLRMSKTLVDALILDWLERFPKCAKRK